MKTFTIVAAVIVAASLNQSAWAQHSDVEFGYDDTSTPTFIEIENDNETNEGIQFYEAEFEELDPFSPGEFGTDSPGFTTEASEGLLFNPGDQIWIFPVDASAFSNVGVGFVNFYNPATGNLEASNQLSVIDNTTGTTNLVLDGPTSSGDALQFLGSVDASGNLHDHIVVDLLDDATAPAGAYGMMFQVHADFDGDGIADLVSDPLWFIFNHKMSDSDFDNLALPSFGVTGEPGLLGDVNMDGVINFLDIAPFIELLSTGGYRAEADIDQNGMVDFLDIFPFIQILSGN